MSDPTPTADRSCRYCGVHDSDMDDLGLVWAPPDACSWCYDELHLDAS
jgi:hypothetical protein